MADSSEEVGFIGLGTMGQPMAANLLRAGAALVVWNRSAQKCDGLVLAGAKAAGDPGDVFARCETVILMLGSALAVDQVLARGTDSFAGRVNNRLLINMATIDPNDSECLERDVVAAGGRYVEAPVSGSRKPAESGQLVAMLAGQPVDVEVARSFVAPMCRSAIDCGVIPNALHTKLAVNTFLTAVVTGLAEALHFAERKRLDVASLVAVLDAGPLASDVSRVKAAKLLARDFDVQASIGNVLQNVQLIAKTARDVGIALPILDACVALYRETCALGLADADMIAVIRAIEQRTLAA